MSATVRSYVELSYLGKILYLRYFLVALVALDLKNRYKRSILGIGWSMAKPIGMTVILCLMFAKIFKLPWQEMAPYLMCSLAIWNFILESATFGCDSFSSGSQFIKQTPLPLALFSLRAALSLGVNMIIGLTISLGLAMILKSPVNIFYVPYALPGIALLFVLGWSISTIFGLLHTYFPDTKYLLELTLQMLYYLSPIIYPLETFKERVTLFEYLHYNPITHIVEVIRYPIVNGAAPPLISLGVVLACTVVSLIISILLLRKLERHLVFWV